MDRLNRILNVIIGSFIGTFIGRACYLVWDFKAHPEWYAIQSAPWYTGILVSGAATSAILLLCTVLKAIIRYRQKRK